MNSEDMIDRLRAVASGEADRPIGCTDWISAAALYLDQAADALQARDSRIADLESEVTRLVEAAGEYSLHAHRADNEARARIEELARRLADASGCVLGCYPSCEMRYPDQSCCIARRALSHHPDKEGGK